MKCVVIGSGNAGRPVARILNYIGHEVHITDQKKLEEFAPKYQKILLQMEEEGVELDLGRDMPDEIALFDSAYLSPAIPPESPVRKSLQDNDVKLVENLEISNIIDSLIDIDIIGVTGTLGKTSTTHIIAQIFESAGYDVWKCSSRHGNLLSEVIVEGIINDCHRKSDIAVFELPHGTSRLMSEVKLKIGVLTNIYSDHLDEFDDSLEKYAERKLFIARSSQTLVSTPQCREYLEPVRGDVVYYCPGKNPCQIGGWLKDGVISVDYNLTGLENPVHNPGKGSFKTTFNLMGYYFENSLAASAVALIYGLGEDDIKKGLSNFTGISGHLEFLGMYCGREIQFDTAFVPEGLVSTLEQFQNNELVVIVDNPDTTTVRDKFKVGEVIGRYADVIISSGFNETLGSIDMDAANEVLRGAGNQCQKIVVEDMITAGETSIKVTKPGDTIIHVGPGGITNYDDVKQKMLNGIEAGCRKYR